MNIVSWVFGTCSLSYCLWLSNHTCFSFCCCFRLTSRFVDLEYILPCYFGLLPGCFLFPIFFYFRFFSTHLQAYSPSSASREIILAQPRGACLPVLPCFKILEDGKKDDYAAWFWRTKTWFLDDSGALPLLTLQQKASCETARLVTTSRLDGGCWCSKLWCFLTWWFGVMGPTIASRFIIAPEVIHHFCECFFSIFWGSAYFSGWT